MSGTAIDGIFFHVIGLKHDFCVDKYFFNGTLGERS